MVVSVTQVDLKSGMNVLKWRSIGGLADMMTSASPILIRKVEVTGETYCLRKCKSAQYTPEYWTDH